MLVKVKPASAQARADAGRRRRAARRDPERVPAAAARRAQQGARDRVRATARTCRRCAASSARCGARSATPTRSFIAKYKLSGQAALGIYFARLPGKLLETYRAPSRRAPLGHVRAAQPAPDQLPRRSDRRATSTRRAHAGLGVESCDELAVRPLAWDLVAATLQWDGKEKEYTVTKLDRMDDEGRVYRASVRISGAPNLVEIWDRHRPEVRRGSSCSIRRSNLYAIKSRAHACRARRCRARGR